MSRSLKVIGNHVMYDRDAWFLREIMSSRRTLCCLPSKSIFSFCSRYDKTIISFGFWDIQNDWSLGKDYLAQPLASPDKLDYSVYNKNFIQSLFIICHKKVENNIPLSSMAFQLRHKRPIGYVAMKVNTDKSISTYLIKGWHSCVFNTTTSSSKTLTMT